jgi:hypothetical protein
MTPSACVGVGLNEEREATYRRGQLRFFGQYAELTNTTTFAESGAGSA